MNTTRFFLACSCIALLGHPVPGKAEDIDLYSSIASATTGLPNVLFILDNAANFSANASSGCTYGDDGQPPTLGDTAGGIEQCALVDAINALPVKADGSAVVNIGIMGYNATGMTALYGCNASGAGGCLIMPLTAMDAAGKANTIGAVGVKGIKNWDINDIKADGEATGQAMQEAWAYYAGKTGLSGTTYTSPALSGCQKNYVIFIGNSFGAQGTPGELGSTSPSTALTTTVDNNTALTADQKSYLKEIIQIAAGPYGSSTITCDPNPYQMSNHHDTDNRGLYADEWARYMHDVDIKLGSMPSARHVVTYTIGVLGSACNSEYPALLTSMALRGGGKYFPTGNAADITQAILRVLNEVQAVNSVFSSSSLPVSVNTQGTYLNQIFMGMFRPDEQGNPRWKGNLKQYQFTYDETTQNLFLSDALAIDAISAAGTGFLSPNAASFWTCGNTSRSNDPALAAPYDSLATCSSDPTMGFWANDPISASTPGKGYDLPDGEVVEKGGAGQMLRLANLRDDYSTTPGSSTNPRKLYTYCPGGTCTYPNDCSGDPTSPSCQLSNTANVFDRSNAALTDALLGTGPQAISSIVNGTTVAATAVDQGASGTLLTVSITALTKSNPVVTATVSAADLLNLAVGTQLRIATGGAKFDCDPCTVTGIDAATNQFTYSVTGGGGSATLPYTATIYTNSVTVTKSAHGLPIGQKVTISACTVHTALNGTIGTVSAVTTDSFTLSTVVSLGTNGTDPDCDYTPNTATVTTVLAHGFATGALVTIAGATPTGYNGDWLITVTDTTHFTYQYTDPAPLDPFYGAGATATSSLTTREALTRWVRGEDNYGDEASLCPPGIVAGTGNCPSPAINIRPSVHGDVLHSRPVVLNYGGTNGVIVFYGGNDGVFRSVNGNQVNPASSTLPAPGHELWGFIPTEFLGKLKRQHDNSPALLMPSTVAGIIPTPQKKDYFVDGSTGVYQVIDGDGITQTAYLYLAMRRGGRLIYALDVSDPTDPGFLWKKSNTTTGFEELGQTWSQPKVAAVNGHTNPVLIFAGGYDANAEDVEPPTTDSMGRGIFILDAITGDLVWKATYGTTLSCPDASAACTLPEMKYSIPSDVTLLDRNSDGKIDRLYVGDMGGNVWRVDFEPSGGNTPAYWQVEKVAALGCNTGVCAAGVTPRKIFYPPEVIASASYDMVFVPTGDREHPLYTTTSINITSTDDSTNRTATASATDVAKIGAVGATNSVTFANGDTCTVTVASTTTFTYSTTGCGASGAQQAEVISTQSACFATNRAYLLKDMAPGLDGSGLTALTETDLFNATTTPWDGTLSGYYITFKACEKSVNAPLVVAGYVYFGTNQARAPDTETCEETLGVATGYRLAPFTGTYISGEFEGGGLPPSPVSGIVNIVDASGETTLVPFCIGCGGGHGGSGNGGGGGVADPCASDSALAGCKPPIEVLSNRYRTYWYIDGK
jgi:type IV pilus assembly protein PilY1